MFERMRFQLQVILLRDLLARPVLLLVKRYLNS